MAHRKDPKESLSALEKKLMTNLFENDKASVFSKPLTNQRNFTSKCAPLSNSSPAQYMQKVQRFPTWCQSVYVPAHYHNIEKLVSGPGGIDGQRVSSLLLSSGLPNPLLGKIWELCSGTISGSFTQQELYAALALVAVVQAGYPPALEILFQLPQAPLPAFVQQQTISTTTVPQAHSTTSLETATMWRHYPVPPNMHPPSSFVSLPQDPRQGTHARDSNFVCLQDSASRAPAFTPAVTAAQSSVSLLDVSSSTTKVATSCPQTAEVPARPAVWCSEVRRPDSACSVPAVRLDTNVLTPSLMSQGSTSTLQDAKIDSFDDFSDDFNDFMSATTETSTADDAEDLFGRKNLVTEPKASGDFEASLLDTTETSVVTSSGDVLDVDFKGLGIATKETNSPSVANNVDVKCMSSKKRKPPLPKAGNLTMKNMGNAKPFRFKIDISALTASKPVAAKPSDRKPRDVEEKEDVTDFSDFSSASAPEAVEDDFADFQQAFPDTKVTDVEGDAIKPAEDRYSVFKDLASETMVRWSEPADSEQGNENWAFGAVGDSPQLSTVAVQGGLFAEPEESEDFGDFCHVTVPPSLPSVQSPPAPPAKETDFLELSSHTPEQVRKSNPSQDALSLGDRLSVYSLELGGRNGSSSSHHGSVLSLELRMGNSDGTDDEESPRMGSDDGCGVSASADETASCDIASDTQEETGNFQSTQPAFFLDKYSFIREVSQQPADDDDCVDRWVCCLRGILEIIQTANSFFGREASSQVCREALETEEGANYVKNITEVCKVCKRIKLSSELAGKQSETLEKLCLEVQSIWEDIVSFLENSCLFSVPPLPAGNAKWMPNLDESSKACGICLLHVDNPEITASKLTYGAREYHAPCANLWVNCVSSLLPAIPYPDLL